MSLTVQTYGHPDQPAILFLHGAGVSSWMWTEQIEQLKTDFYCITVDLPNCGESYQEEWTSFEDTAAQLAQIVRTRSKAGVAHIVGLSLGGYTALHLLAQHPEVVNTMIVSGVTTQPFRKQWLYRPLLNLVALISKWDIMITLSSKMMNLPDEAAALYKRDTKRTPRTMLQRVYRSLFDFALPATVLKTSHRVLGVAGAQEAAMIKDDLTAFKQLPNGAARLAPHAHHGWNGEHPQLFTDMIRAWVTGQPLPETLVPV